VTALRLRWLWLEWTDESKAWIGLGNPCNDDDREIFYAATIITIGDGEKEKFWSSSLALRIATYRHCSKIFKISKKKKQTVKKVLENNFWVSQINLRQGLEAEHIQQVVTLWELASNVKLSIGIKDYLSEFYQ
jgi:hypothetical protein